MIRLIQEYDGDEMEPVPTALMGKEHIPVFQDESIFHTNEFRHRVWIPEGKQPLRKKGNGRSIHVLDFITQDGRLALTEDDQKVIIARDGCLPTKTDARVIIHPGKGHDAWWDGEQLAKQVSSGLNEQHR
jgi:hypothetical protein